MSRQRQIGIMHEDLPKIAKRVGISPDALPGLKLVPETIEKRAEVAVEKKTTRISPYVVPGLEEKQ